MAKGRIRQQAKRSSTIALVLSMLLMLSVVLLMLLALGILSLPVSHNDLDSTPISNHFKFNRKFINHNIVDTDVSESREDQWTEILSWEPRAFLYHNFLSKKECEYLINLAKPHMAKSTVVDSKTGKSKDSRVRTSSGMFLKRGRDKIITNIEKRIADFSFIPADHGEGLQVLHYEVGQKYEPHYDYFLDEFNTKNGGQRIATVLMYLKGDIIYRDILLIHGCDGIMKDIKGDNWRWGLPELIGGASAPFLVLGFSGKSDVEEGGETVFPAAKGNFSSLPGWNEWSDCAKKGLSVKPKMGNALLFWSMRPDASLDPSSLHGGCPVIKGNKWSSTKWMHVDEYKL